MAVTQKQVDYCVEVDAILNVVVVALKDVKAGKALVSVVSDLVPLLITALSGVSQLATEVTAKAALENTVALKVTEILQALGA